MFERFPKVDAVVIDEPLNNSAELGKHVRHKNSKIPVIRLSPRIGAHERWADKTVNSHDPAALLKILEEMGGRTDIWFLPPPCDSVSGANTGLILSRMRVSP